MIEVIHSKSRYLHRESDGKQVICAEIIADTAAELAGVTEIRDVSLAFGSTALTADGKALMLDSEGVWHDMSDGSEVSGT